MPNNEIEVKKEHKKLIFAIKFIIWTTFSCVIPILLIVYKFILPTGNEGTMQFGIWAIIALIIFMSFSKSLVKYINELNMGAWQSLLLSGIVNTTIPLVLVYLCLVALGDNIKDYEWIVLAIAGSETISFPFNPFPKLINQNILGFIEKGIDKVKGKLKWIRN